MKKAVLGFLLVLLGLSSFMAGQLTTTFTATIYSTVTETTTYLSQLSTTVKQYVSSIVTVTRHVTKTTVQQTTITTSSPPAPPSNLRVQNADFGSIVLTWQDNSVDEEGFRIERSEDNEIFTTIGETPPNTMNFVDTSVESEKTYFYRVRAYRGEYVTSPSNTVAETATPYGIPLSNYFGGLGELETVVSNVREREGFADIFNPYWNWMKWPQGSKGAKAEASIDFNDFVSGAGSQKISIQRTNESGEDTRLILTSWKIQPKNPTYKIFYPLPGEKIVFTFSYKTSEKVINIEYAVMMYFIVRDNTGNERYLPPLYVLRTQEASPFWRKVSFTAEVPANFTAVRIYAIFTCRKSCAGTFWLDSFVLHTEPEKRLPLLGKDKINFKLAAIHGEVFGKDPLELAQKYDLLLGGLATNTYVKGLNTQVLSLLYFNDPSLASSRRNSSNTPPCMMRWNGTTPVYEFLHYWPSVYGGVSEEWLLSASSSAKYPRINSSGYFIVREKYCEFLVDIGREDVIETALKNIEMLYVYAGYRNPTLSPILFHDNLPNFVYLWNMDGAPPSKYPDRETRKIILDHMLNRLKKSILDPYPDRKIIANIGTYSNEEFQYVVRFDYDGVLIEYFTRIFNKTLSPSLLYQQFHALKNYPDNKVVVLVDTVPGQYVELWNENPMLVPENVRRHFGFVLAALYLLNRPNTYITLRGDEGGYSSSYILKDFYLPLGRPLQDLETVEGDEKNGALFLRRYSNGLVLLNTASSRSFTYFVAEKHRDRAGNVFTGLITIPPQTGLVLYRNETQSNSEYGTSTTALTTTTAPPQYAKSTETKNLRGNAPIWLNESNKIALNTGKQTTIWYALPRKHNQGWES
ncbi:MAG: fibronectin type III domain-containing protein [Candidatus Caldarchaeum sp.]